MTDTFEEQVLKSQDSVEEENLFISLRASSWDDFHGQSDIKEALQIALTAAKKRKEAMDHVLFYGPPGLGKTTLSNLIAHEMGSNIRVTSGPAITRSGDLAAILTNLEKGDILFIDEIHRLNTTVEEMLYSAMEDYALDIILGKGPAARSVRIDLPQFTLVGATTKAGNISGPLRDRFGVIHRLQFYESAELAIIIRNAAKKLNIMIDEESLEDLAKRSRGTPRIALKLLKRVRDYAQVKGQGKITKVITDETLKMLHVDAMGLDNSDRSFLNAIITLHNGGPVGVETLAATIAEDTATIEEVIEPYLLQIGFLQKSPRGRMATRNAYLHLGKEKEEK